MLNDQYIYIPLIPVPENLADLNGKIKEEKVQPDKATTNNLAEINENAWKCNMCDKVMVSMLNLRHHLVLVHKVVLSRGQCHICSQMCQRKLSQHLMSTHRMIKVLMGFASCNKCGISVEKRNLKRHNQIVHEKLQKSECDICKKTLSTKLTLKTHVQQVHMKMKKIECHLCGKRFPQNQNLLWHISGVHEKLKLYQCSICGKHFAQTGSLQLHSKTIHKKTIYENTI